MKRAALALLVLGAVLAVSSPARAEEQPLVTVVRPAGGGAEVDEATTRLAAELRAAGFEVHIVMTEGAPAEARALATMAVVAGPRGARIEVRVADRERHVDTEDPALATAASDLAIRSVELLRASLQELRARPSSPKAEAVSGVAKGVTLRASPAPKPVARAGSPVPSRAPLLGTLEAGVALLAGGSLGVAPGPLLKIAVGRKAGFSLRLSLVPSLVSTTITAPAGALSLQQDLSTLALSYAFGDERAPVYPLVSLGGGLYQLHVEGRARAPYRSERGDRAAAALSTGAGVGVRISPSFTAIAELEALLLAPRPAVAVLDHEVGRAGWVTFFPSIGIVAGF